MTRPKLLSEIKYALNYINYTEEKEKQVKKAYKKLKKDLVHLKKLKKAYKILIDFIPKLEDFKWDEKSKCYVCIEEIDFDKMYSALSKEEYELLKEVQNER